MKACITQRHFHLKHNANLRIIFKQSIHIKAQDVYTFLFLMRNAPKIEEKSQQRPVLRLLASE